MRTSNQVTGSLTVGAAAAAIVVWLLGRTIGLSADETNVLGPALTAIFAGAGAFFSPYLPKPRHNDPDHEHEEVAP